MKVENPETWRKNVSNMFKTKFNMDNDSLCRNIEISIFNHTLREAGNKKIVKKWENKYFVQLTNEPITSKQELLFLEK